VKTRIQKNRFLLEFIPMEIGAGMTKTHMWPIAKIAQKTNQLNLTPGACLREAASAKAGERAGVRGIIPGPPPP